MKKIIEGVDVLKIERVRTTITNVRVSRDSYEGDANYQYHYHFNLEKPYRRYGKDRDGNEVVYEDTELVLNTAQLNRLTALNRMPQIVNWFQTIGDIHPRTGKLSFGNSAHWVIASGASIDFVCLPYEAGSSYKNAEGEVLNHEHRGQSIEVVAIHLSPDMAAVLDSALHPTMVNAMVKMMEKRFTVDTYRDDATADAIIDKAIADTISEDDDIHGTVAD